MSEAAEQGEPRFGVVTYEAAAWDELTERWRWLDGLGVDQWVADHLWSARVPEGWRRPRFDAWVMLAGMALATSVGRVGTLVCSTAYRHPAVIAKQAVTVDHASGGRLQLGLGVGANPNDAQASGEPSVAPAVLTERFEEAVRLISSLIRSDSTTWHGPRLDYDKVPAGPRPLQVPGPPLILAGHRAASIRLAAEVADGWCSYGGTATIARSSGPVPSEQAYALTRHRLQQLEAAASEAGRDPRDVRRIFLAGFTDDPIWDSPSALQDLVGRYRQIGIDDFAFLYPSDGVDRRQFEHCLGR